MTIQRKRVAKRLASGLLAGAVAFGGLALSGASPAGAVPIQEDADQRLGGADRFATASLIAEELEDQVGADLETVIVANGDNFPDALAAAPLAGDSIAILLVHSDSIPSVIRDRMNRLADSVQDVLVVGGTSAVSADVFAEIEDIFDSADVARFAGDDRYATAAAIAEEVGYSDLVVLVSGTSFADSVTAGAWAATQGYPVLLANGSGLPSATSDALETALDDGASRVVIVGGPAAVGSGVEADLVELGFDPAAISRIQGADRYQTNLLFNAEVALAATSGLNKQLDNGEYTALNGTTLMLASGANFPDALAAAPLAAQLGAHLILVDPTTVGSSALTLAAVGGSPAVSDAAVYGVFAALTDSAALGMGGAGLFGESVWVVGGTSAVPSSTISAMATAASQTVNCSVIVAGGNAENTGEAGGEGPDSVLIAFSGDMQTESSLAAVDEETSDTEDTLVQDTTEMAAVLQVEGDDADIDGIAALDLNKNGFTDAILVTLNAELVEGDEVEFLGWEADTEDYSATSALYVRNFGSCSATVAEDEDAPTATITTADSSEILVIEFDEALGDDNTLEWASDIETALDEWAVEVEETASFDCTNVDYGNSLFVCTDADETPLAFATGDVITFASDFSEGDGGDWTEVFYDSAGNFVAEAELEVEASLATPEIDSVAVTCTTFGAGLQKAAKWDGDYAAGGTSVADTVGTIDLDMASGAITLTAKSGAGGLAANGWNVTITHERGLLIPTIAVDGTDVTMTIDKYVHTGADIMRVWNNSSVGRGGLAPKWAASVSGAGDENLVDTEILDEALNTVNSGTEGTNSCAVTITLDSITAMSLSDTTGAPSSAGEIRVIIDGVAQTLTDIQYAGAADAGYVIEGLVNATTESGVTRVTAYVEDLSGTNSDSDATKVSS